jgi:starvation-inducible DNA-binding protein
MGSTDYKQPLYATRIDLSAETRAQVIGLLNQTLALTLDLKTQVKQAHWNVKGLDFYQLHELFDELAGELEAFVDLVAERVTALGGLALGTARIAAQMSTLPEYPFDIVDGKDHVIALADRYAIYAKLVRQGITKTDELGDADTADLYTEVSRAIDKRLWFLEAHLQAGVAAGDNGSVPLSSEKATTGQTKAKAK